MIESAKQWLDDINKLATETETHNTKEEIKKRSELLSHLIEQAEQNNSYREAIERALGESGWGDEGNALYRTIGILTKALEESE